MSPPTTRLRQSSRTKRNTLGVTPTSPPPIVVREQEQEEESKDFRETTLWRRGKPLKKKQYPGQGNKVNDRKHLPKSKVDDRKHPPSGGGGGGSRGVGGVGGGDVRGDERTNEW